MSRVGKTIIHVPQGVVVEYSNGTIPTTGHNGFLVSVTGPKGVLIQEIKSPIFVTVENNQVHVKRHDDLNESRALHGLYNRLIQNMILGVTKGFEKTLVLNGVGYKANMKGEDLVLNLGYSHPCEVKAEAGIKFKILNPQEIQALNLGKDGIGVVIQIQGTSKEKVGAVASKIRDLRKVEPYHMYGIRYNDEHVIRKESKSGKKK
jgi:large subunit ribosomal protein L6